jgi:hypothetical protein
LISFLSGLFSLFTPGVCSSHLFKPCSAIAGLFFYWIKLQASCSFGF